MKQRPDLPRFHASAVATDTAGSPAKQTFDWNSIDEAVRVAGGGVLGQFRMGDPRDAIRETMESHAAP